MAKSTKKVKLSSRARRKKGLRKRISGTLERPRLSVFKSDRHIYAQIICDKEGKTLASASTLDEEVKKRIADVEAKQMPNESRSLKSSAGARAVGLILADRAKGKGIEKVVFDRNGFIYHGRLKELATGAREGGLVF